MNGLLTRLRLQHKTVSLFDEAECNAYAITPLTQEQRASRTHIDPEKRWLYRSVIYATAVACLAILYAAYGQVEPDLRGPVTFEHPQYGELTRIVTNDWVEGCLDFKWIDRDGKVRMHTVAC